MNKLGTVDYIIYATVLCYGIYLTVQNMRLFLANKKVKKEYLSKHKDGYTMVNQYLPCMVFFLGFSMINITGIFVMEKSTKDELYVCFALTLMAIISAGMTLDSIVKRRAIADDDDFVYEKAHYRFRSILSMNPVESVIKNVNILTTERQHIMVSKEMGVYLHECFLAQGERKENKNK